MLSHLQSENFLEFLQCVCYKQEDIMKCKRKYPKRINNCYMKGQDNIKKYKNKTDLIIKTASYFIAGMIVISSIVDKDTYRRIIIQLKNIGIILVAIILLIVVSIVSYKVFKQIKNKKIFKIPLFKAMFLLYNANK